MKFEDIKNLSPSELGKKERELKKNMFDARMKNSLGQLGNPMSIRTMRREIARLKTAQAVKSAKA